MDNEIYCKECNDLGEVNGEGCQACCEHDFDMDEGYMCLNCGKQGDIGALIDYLEYRYEDR